VPHPFRGKWEGDWKEKEGIDKGKKKIERRSCKWDARIGAEEKGGTESGR